MPLFDFRIDIGVFLDRPSAHCAAAYCLNSGHNPFMGNALNHRNGDRYIYTGAFCDAHNFSHSNRIPFPLDFRRMIQVQN